MITVCPIDLERCNIDCDKVCKYDYFYNRKPYAESIHKGNIIAEVPHPNHKDSIGE